METKIIIQDGVAVSPLYKDKILLSNYYLGKPLITNATAVAASGGQLVANGYYYKIVALCDKHIVIDGDSATQLSGLSIDIISTTAQKLRWELTNSGTTRKFELFVGNQRWQAVRGLATAL